MKATGDLGARWCSRVLLEANRGIESMLAMITEPVGASRCLLDVGCWDGASTVQRGGAFGATRLLGIEVFDDPATEAAERGIEVARLDLEAERFPWPDESVDVVVCNQVLEHLKNIWLPMSEMHRVLRLGGRAILSVPNLASVHNRVLLALGRQPSSIRAVGPHVRGFTQREFVALLERGGAYEVEQKRGVGFYPLPSRWSGPLTRLWPGGSHTFVIQARKHVTGSLLDEYVSEPAIGTQTFYEPSGSTPAA